MKTTTITMTSAVSTSSAAQTTTGGLLVKYQVAPPDIVFSVPLDCPGLDGKSRYAHSWTTRPYVISCSSGLFGGDIGSIVAYTIEDCIDACGSLNAWQGNNTACVGVQFNIGMASSLEGDAYGNCYMKNSDAVAGAPQYGMSSSASQPTT